MAARVENTTPDEIINPDSDNGQRASASATPAPTATPHVHKPVEDPAVEATCQHKGLTVGSHCSECGQVIQPQEEIPVMPHMFIGGHCIWCGLPNPDNGDTTGYVIELPAL